MRPHDECNSQRNIRKGDTPRAKESCPTPTFYTTRVFTFCGWEEKEKKMKMGHIQFLLGVFNLLKERKGVRMFCKEIFD